MRAATISHLAHYLPDTVVTHEERGATHPDWDLKRLSETVGFRSAHAAAADQFSSDLATLAARELLADPSAPTPDYVICCTQTPDFPLPTTACLVQDQLGLPTSVGAVDFRLGCSGYAYGWGWRRSGCERAGPRPATDDRHLTKVVNPDRRLPRSSGRRDYVHGVGGCATGNPRVRLRHGWHGCGSVAGAQRWPARRQHLTRPAASRPGLTSQGFDLYMDGASVFSFTIKVVAAGA